LNAEFVIPIRSEPQRCDLIFNWIDHISGDVSIHQIASPKLSLTIEIPKWNQFTSLKLGKIMLPYR